MKKEVRDDVPINISEGEFVLPADVVRYHGLEKIMNMRQMQNRIKTLWIRWVRWVTPDQATLPDDIPFQPQNYQEGGAICSSQVHHRLPEYKQQNQVPGVTCSTRQTAPRNKTFCIFTTTMMPVKVTTPSAKQILHL